jgi:hypothetical protein
LASNGETTPPTKVQNFFLASFLRKKGEVDPVDDANLVALNQYAVDQRAKDLATHQPMGILQQSRAAKAEVIVSQTGVSDILVFQ